MVIGGQRSACQKMVAQGQSPRLLFRRPWDLISSGETTLGAGTLDAEKISISDFKEHFCLFVPLFIFPFTYEPNSLQAQENDVKNKTLLCAIKRAQNHYIFFLLCRGKGKHTFFNERKRSGKNFPTRIYNPLLQLLVVRDSLSLLLKWKHLFFNTSQNVF